MIEMIVVIAVGALLMSMALRGFGDVTSSMAVQNARRNFSALQARARANAIERGDLTRLHVDPDGDSVWIEAGAGRIEVLDFGEDRDVDIRSSASGITTLCMSPRGFGEIRCNSFEDGTVDLEFVQGGESVGLTILPLGQLEW